MPVPEIINFPVIRRTSATPHGSVRHLKTINNVDYSEFVYGSGNVNLDDTVIRNWVRRLIAFNVEQNNRIDAGEQIPPFFQSGEPGFVQQFRMMNLN